MRPIYETLDLIKTALSVVLSLRGSITSDGEEVEQSIDAEVLQCLRVTLSVPNVTGERDLIASGECVLADDKLQIDLSDFNEGIYRLVVKVVFGTQTMVLYNLDIVVPESGLAEGTQEYEDRAIIVSTIADIIGSDLEGLALEATSQEIKSAITPISQAAEAYNTGKVQLAQNITAKGVTASASETLPELAQKVSAITQDIIEIDGGEMYAKQLFGSLETPNYWNLYEVMAALLSHGDLVNYGGILLGEYYKGYDSIAIGGSGAPSAGAGGGYVFSDEFSFNPDGSCNLTVHTEDETHYWNDNADSKGNRWIAWLFAGESHGFSISIANTCPRSIHIGRHVGVIESLVNGRIDEIVITDGNKLDDFRTGEHTQSYNRKFVLRNLANHSSGSLIYNTPIDAIYIQADNISSPVFSTASNGGSVPANISSIIIKTPYFNTKIFSGDFYNVDSKLGNLTIDGIYIHGGLCTSSYYPRYSNLKSINFLDVEDLNFGLAVSYQPETSIPEGKVYISYSTNDKTKSATLVSDSNRGQGWSKIQDVEIKDGWCKPLNISLCTGIIENGVTNNITEHILKRLKQDESDCGDGVTITLGSTNLAKLTSQESIDLLDLLTNTYGYTFA